MCYYLLLQLTRTLYMRYQSVYLFALYHHCQRNNPLDACQVAVLKYKKINITRKYMYDCCYLFAFFSSIDVKQL